MRLYSLLVAVVLCLTGGRAAAQCVPDTACVGPYVRDPATTAQAREEKKAKLRRDGLPERLLPLLDKEECPACVNQASDSFFVMIVYHDAGQPGAVSKRQLEWSARTERRAREDLTAGRIKSFHIYNTPVRCNCCPERNQLGRTPDTYADWNPELEVNNSHVMMFDDKSDLGPLPDDLATPPPGSQREVPPIRRYQKPQGRRYVQVMCPACEPLAAQWNEAAGALDALWDENVRLLERLSVLRNVIAMRANQMAALEWQQQFASTRTPANQQQLAELTKVNDAQQADFDRAASRQAAVAADIASTQAALDALMQKILECEKACKKTTAAQDTTPQPPVAPPDTTAAETGTVGPTLSDAPPAAPPAACRDCEGLAAETRALSQQHFETFEAGARLRQESDALWEQIRADSEAFQTALRRGQAAEVERLRARMNAAVQRRGELEAEIQRNGKLSGDLMMQLLRKGADLKDCNNTCTSTTPPPANDAPAVSPPTTPVSCRGEACAEEWKTCSATNSCPPIDEDCGVPGTCTAAAGDVPVVNVADPAPWSYAGPAAGIIKLVQVKMAEFLDTPGVERSVNASGAAAGLIVPPTAVADVREWFNPLGLLARHIRGQVDRWRGSAGPRPLLTRRDLKLLDSYSRGQSAGLPKGVHVLLTDRGGSTGKTLGLQILNLTGKPVRLAAMPFAIEPIEQNAAQKVQDAFGRLSKALPMKIDLNAYCAEMLKAPPSANTIYRLAPKEIQEKFAPMSKVLRSAYRVKSAGLLNPDSNPSAYADAIKQWAVWAVEQKFDEARFTDAFVGHTRKNVEAAGQQWSRPVEDAIRKASPNRWRDVAKILRGAGVAVPQ